MRNNRNLQYSFITLALCASTACGPQLSDGLGETAGDTTGDGDGDGDGDGVFCIEDQPATSCWVQWGADYARVMFDCEIATAQVVGAFGPAFEDKIEPWGAVTCHEVIKTDHSVCFWGPSNIVIARDADEWAPIISETAGAGASSSPPC